MKRNESINKEDHCRQLVFYAVIMILFDSSHIGVGKNLQLNAQKCRFHAAILLFELYLEAV